MDAAGKARSGFRGFLINLCLLAATAVLIGALGEVGVRLFEPRSDRQPLVEMLKGSDRLWGYFPDRTVLRNGVIIRTNSLGQRGGEASREKAPGTYRILGLGDSYTFGTGVKFEDTYLQVLERELNASGSTAPRYEVMNAGVEGYNTVQELATYRENGSGLKPDLVLVGYLFNDVDEPSGPGAEGGGGGVAPASEGLSGKIVSLKQRSHFFAFLSPRVGALLRRMGVKRTGYVGAYVRQFRDGSPGWRKSRQALLDLKADTGKDGGRVAVLVLPALVSLGEADYPLHPYHDAVVGFCRANGIPVLDLYPVFAGERAERYWVSITDPHPNAAADRKIGDAIYRFLVSERLVPAS